MIKFKVSAPGRMMLCGEHVIMYGKLAVAASLDLRTTLEFSELINDPIKIIKIEFPDVNLSLNLPLELIQNFFFINDFFPRFQSNILLLKHVQYFITINDLWSTCEQKYSLQTFLYLFLLIAYIKKLNIKSFHVSLTTQLPINAGFGSSTSFAVCLAACFLHWSRLQKGTHNDFDKEELQQIMCYTLICEKDAQNYGVIDSTVCARGQVLEAQYENPIDCNTKLLKVPRMKILFIDSGIRHNKYEQVMIQMAQMKQSDPDQSESFLRTVDTTSKRISLILVEISKRHNNKSKHVMLNNWYTLLERFISSNQDILHKSGLSHPKLDTICSIAKNYGFVGKLTGFGYAYILLPPNSLKEKVTNLVIDILRAGFATRMTSVSCNGVKLDEV